MSVVVEPARFSKWLRHVLLLSLEDMEACLDFLGSFCCIRAGMTTQASIVVSKEEFLHYYTLYLEEMQHITHLASPALRRFFSLFWTVDPADVAPLLLSQDKILMKPIKPVVQVQLCHCLWNKQSHRIDPMALHADSFSFGLQISYPQIYEDPQTHQFSKVLLSQEFSATPLFLAFVQWMRAHTQPVVVSIAEKKIASTVRMGKKSVSLLALHQGLQRALVC